MRIKDFLDKLFLLENLRENELINIGAGKEFESNILLKLYVKL